INGREFAVPDAPTALHVEKVIEEAVCARRVRRIALWRVPQESQGHTRARDCFPSRHEAAFHGERIAAQGKAGSRDGGWSSRIGVVAHESVVGIHLMTKVREGRLLEVVQEWCMVDRMRTVLTHTGPLRRKGRRRRALQGCR